MKYATPPTRGTIIPVVFRTVKELGGGDLNTIWKNIVTTGKPPSKVQVQAALDNGISRGYFVFSHSSGRRIYAIASAQYQADRRKIKKQQKKKAATLKIRQQQAAHARAVLAKKRAAKKAELPVHARSLQAKERAAGKQPAAYEATVPSEPLFGAMWLVVSGLGGAAWGFLTGFALAVWVVV